jgi:hypothetical protein
MVMRSGMTGGRCALLDALALNTRAITSMRRKVEQYVMVGSFEDSYG